MEARFVIHRADARIGAMCRMGRENTGGPAVSVPLLHLQHVLDVEHPRASLVPASPKHE